jgi:hypothetical protein
VLWLIMRLGVIVLFCSGLFRNGTIWAQSEAALRAFFEGKQVKAKIEMPGSHEGIDLYVDRQPTLDFNRYGQRLKRFPKSILEGDTVRVTNIKVNKRNIEFQLDGGGFGTSGDSRNTSLPTVNKSARERELESQLKKETDTRRRDQISRELDFLRRDREREERLRTSRQAEIDERERFENEQRRKSGGSRFNVWYPEGYLKESVPTPEQLMRTLEEYVDFGKMGTAKATSSNSLETRSPNATAARSKLRTGQRREEVRSLLGPVKTSRKRNEGSLVVETDVFNDGNTLTEVDFINGVSIQFRVTDK